MMLFDALPFRVWPRAPEAGEVLEIGGQSVAGERGADLVRSLACRLDDHVAGTVDIIDVVADSAGHRVVAGAAVERVVAAAPVQCVVAAEAVENVRVGRVGIGRAVIAVEHVDAGRAGDRVGPRAAEDVDHVIAVADRGQSVDRRSGVEG
jgi:hypothetical protein